MNLYLSREQRHPKGFVAFEGRRERGGGSNLQVSKGTETARMFAFDFADPAYGDCGQAITSNGTLCDTVVFPGAVPTTQQRDRAQEFARLQSTAPNGAATARCFEPHHAIVFFDSKGVPVSEMTLCFECGNLRLSPGNGAETGMTDDAARFFADTCRSLAVGGCPPEGANRMPDLPPPPDAALSSAEYQSVRVHRAFARPHGIPGTRRVNDLTAAERRVFCGWLGSAVRFTGQGAHCADGRSFSTQESRDCVEKSAAPCNATIEDISACARSRFEPLCGADAPSCARSDGCRWAVLGK